jgi:hypothetical protein
MVDVTRDEVEDIRDALDVVIAGLTADKITRRAGHDHVQTI